MVDVCATFSADGPMGERETKIMLCRGRETKREHPGRFSRLKDRYRVGSSWLIFLLTWPGLELEAMVLFVLYAAFTSQRP